MLGAVWTLRGLDSGRNVLGGTAVSFLASSSHFGKHERESPLFHETSWGRWQRSR